MEVFQSPPAEGPLDTGREDVDLTDEQVDDAVEDVVFVRDVVVQRHRLNPEFLAKPTHTERVDAGGIGERDRSLEHPFFAERGTAIGVGISLSSHRFSSIDTLTYRVSLLDSYFRSRRSPSFRRVPWPLQVDDSRAVSSG